MSPAAALLPDDFVRRAITDPALYHAMNLMAYGHSREDVLFALAVDQSKRCEWLTDECVRLRSLSPTTYIVTPKGEA